MQEQVFGDLGFARTHDSTSVVPVRYGFWSGSLRRMMMSAEPLQTAEASTR
jgi:hypothetical protein